MRGWVFLAVFLIGIGDFGQEPANFSVLKCPCLVKSGSESASRLKHRGDVKQKLYLKFFGGPKAGLFYSDCERQTNDAKVVADQVLRGMNKAGLPTSLADLRIKARSFGTGTSFADGIFADAHGTFGYILYAPGDLQPSEIEELLYHSLDPVPFFLASQSGKADLLFDSDILPPYPHMPPATAVLWTKERGVTSGQSRRSDERINTTSQ